MQQAESASKSTVIAVIEVITLTSMSFILNSQSSHNLNNRTCHNNDNNNIRPEVVITLTDSTSRTVITVKISDDTPPFGFTIATILFHIWTIYKYRIFGQ